MSLLLSAGCLYCVPKVRKGSRYQSESTAAKGSSHLRQVRTNGLQEAAEIFSWYKKSADSVPLNICLLCNSYLQKLAKWHSAEVCLCLISLITLFPDSALLDQCSLLSGGGYNLLKTNFLFCFEVWSRPNLLPEGCVLKHLHCASLSNCEENCVLCESKIARAEARTEGVIWP